MAESSKIQELLKALDPIVIRKEEAKVSWEEEEELKLQMGEVRKYMVVTRFKEKKQDLVYDVIFDVKSV